MEEPTIKLTNRGYVIYKDTVDKKTLKNHIENLTVKPLVNSDYNFGKIRPFRNYSENQKKLYIPRFYGQRVLPNWQDIPRQFAPNFDIDIKFNGQLRPPQKPIVKATLETLEKEGGGVICAGCGVGKTIMALYISTVIGKKTLIVVHKEFLMNQWRERIAEYIPTARVGTIQGPIKNTKDKDIVLAMLQTISLKDEFSRESFHEFGLTIVDECHHISAEKFSRALPKISSEYMLGLSATPQRADGLSKVFHWYLGNICYKYQRENEHQVVVRRILMKHSAFKEKLNFRGKPNQAIMLNDLFQMKSRNNIIFGELMEVIQTGRQILVLSARREHLEMLKDMIDAAKICTTGFYVGGMKESALKDSEDKQVIFATMQMAQEGLDIPGLNALFMVLLGTANIEQAVGRILRKKENIDKVIVDFVDMHSCFERQGTRRIAFYKKSNYQIINVFYEQGSYVKEQQMVIKKTTKTAKKKTADTDAEDTKKCDFDSEDDIEE